MTESVVIKSTGVPEIDTQHRQLLAHLDRLLLYIQRGHGFAATIDAFAALFEYTQTHFQYEEDWLRENAYPWLDEHIAAHQAIAADLNSLRTELEAGEDVSDKLAERLRTWILNHIDIEDFSYANHLGTADA